MNTEKVLAWAAESMRPRALTRDERRVLDAFFGPEPFDVLETIDGCLTSSDSRLLLSALWKVDLASG